MTMREAPDVQIVACTDGPLLVRGPLELVDGHGDAIPRTRATVALCRCGVSAVKPFCDGTHKLIGFRAPADASPGGVPGQSDSPPSTEEPDGTPVENPSGSGIRERVAVASVGHRRAVG
jgi:CDGSH-type Zn-finger protein